MAWWSPSRSIRFCRRGRRHASMAYYPNQYHDNANWMQLTIIFPQPGSVDGGLLLNNDAGPTATPDPDGDEISG